MPRANQYLLLYVLDLLSVFARKSDKNLMTAASPSFPLLFLSPLPSPSLPQISPSSSVPVLSLTLITSFPPANISSAKESSSSSSINRTVSCSTYHLHHVRIPPPHGVHHPALSLIFHMTQTIPILSYPAPMTNIHPPAGGSSSERTTDAFPAGALRTKLSVGYPPLRHRALPFRVAEPRLFYLVLLHGNLAILHLLFPFLM